MNRENILKLAHGVAAVPAAVIEDHFDMQCFFEDREERTNSALEDPRRANMQDLLRTHCNTAACFLGFGPLVGIQPRKGADYTWFSYSENFIDNRNGPAWEWLFDSSWADVGKPLEQRRHAVARALALVEDEAAVRQLWRDLTSPYNPSPNGYISWGNENAEGLIDAYERFMAPWLAKADELIEAAEEAKA